MENIGIARFESTKRIPRAQEIDLYLIIRACLLSDAA